MRILFFILFVTLTFGAQAQQPDNLIMMDRANPEMEKAFAWAKATVDEFIHRATEERSEDELYGAYIRVEEPGDVVEYLWVTDFKRYDDQHFMGVLITKPQLVKQFSDGATVGFVKEDIHDWQIFNKKTEKLEGAFTHKVLQGSQ